MGILKVSSTDILTAFSPSGSGGLPFLSTAHGYGRSVASPLALSEHTPANSFVSVPFALVGIGFITTL